MTEEQREKKDLPTAWLSGIVDLATRQRLEEELGMFKAIVAFSNDAIVSKTLDGIVTSWNQAAERLFGYSAQEAIGQHITLIVPVELHQEEEEIVSKLRQDIPVKHYDTVRQRKDGSKIEVSLSISPIKNSEGKILGATKIARDITERRALEQRKDEFLTIASHELKTPMSVLKGLTQLLLRKGKRQDWQGVEPMLRRLDAQVDRLTRLANELLDASTIQAGQLVYDEQLVDMVAVVGECVELLQSVSPTHTLHLSAPSHAWVMGDKDRLGQVVVNLISNAIKYSPSATAVEIALTTQENSVTLTVADHGPGIPKAQQQHIFERLYRASADQTRKISGLGLGLYISSEIIKRHGGEIRVQSEEGQGATFIVSLPRSQ